MKKAEINSQDIAFRRAIVAKRKRFSGVVIGDAMDKTIVIRINRVKSHPKYRKQYTIIKKFKVHDPQNKYHKGDQVEFVECRPISKEKRWRVIYKNQKGTNQD
ncbi:MAG: 30S ribosomal protein S17 [Candidatus Kerfeldbacteria bacterium CG08_land_8_20_14_0_20_40_16]|uniref:Small ribosomal subunit protein uS17 n=1 Tax=Candidatus Kerfeldbacteria bacterium CG08_land_8_20_14_0_20_40_16 TaxID=2014244 RepID=A0A2H0YUU9_9BACT|nr:MAG: 30S ribosomal protein S17 [Candidatus Kerfeldbacteria bacterium CG08_land_8_20_14_0_20_40_16]